MKKENQRFIPYIMPIALVVVSLVIGFSFKSAFDNINNIRVTGSAKVDFESDLIVWESWYGCRYVELNDGYKKLEKDRKIIEKYFLNNNISLDDIVFSAISIEEEYDTKTDKDGIRYKEFSAFVLEQTIKVESKKVQEIERLSRDITSLINKGVSIQSSKPHYFYTKLADLKLDMISKATDDARDRAFRIANSADSDLGALLSAQMGVFQITAKNSTENYTWGGRHNKTSKHKTATVTMKLSYNLN